MAKTDTQYIKITLTGSVIGRIEPQKRTAKALGLRRINDSVVVPDNAPIRGMVRAIGHLVTVEGAEAPVKRTKKADKRKAAAAAEAAPVKIETKKTEETKVETKKPAAEKKPAAAKKATTAAKPVEKKAATAAKPAAAKKAVTTAKPAAAKAPAAKKATTPKKESK